MFCESCGSFIPDGQSFCSNCGAAAPVQPAPQAAPQPVQPVQQYAQPAPQPVQSVQQYAQPVQQAQPVYVQPVVAIPAQPRKSSGMAIAGLILAVLGIIAGIIIQETFWVKVGREIDNGLNDIYEELETYDTGYKPNPNPDEFFIDGDFVTTDKGYVSGVLHIDNFSVEY